MRLTAGLIATVLVFGTGPGVAPAQAQQDSRWLFGAKRDGAEMKPAVYGSYTRGCVAGAEKLPDDGETWQAMRLSRNRHWAHPKTIALVKRLSRDGKRVGWNGLLVGDLTQPRGGPMTSGHASHQAGLDADVWLTPMPDRRLSRKEREETSAISMLQRDRNGVIVHQKLSKKRFTKAHAGIIETAARYREVERIFVHPAIKKELCEQNPDRPAWLRKVRSQFGHHYHFHIRLGCPAGSPGCRPQRPIPSYGCEKANLKWWLNVAYGPPKKPAPGAAKKAPPKKKRAVVLSKLPTQCRAVLTAKGTSGSPSQTVAEIAALLPAHQRAATVPVKLGANVAVPTLRTGAPTEQALAVDNALRPPAPIGN